MKTKFKSQASQMWCALALGMTASLNSGAAPADAASSKPAEAIPWSQLGARAGADYKGEGLAVNLTAEAAQLHCVFQRLEGEATREGLWLTSTVTSGVSDRFQVVALAAGRQSSPCRFSSSLPIAKTGIVSLVGQTARFTRPGLVEEYSVSMDGVRQDFVVLERPSGTGELAVQLAVSGAKVEAAACGAQLVLENSGRKIAYNRLRVTDATGKELSARIEVLESEITMVVNDGDAVYPVRLDPTFSDANWISMNPSIPGASGSVSATAVDGAGNLYIGGNFTLVGDAIVNNVAKWDGSKWSALGSGVSSGPYYARVFALAVSGSDLYAGGEFTTAGDSAATNIAKWNGNSWSALGTGMDRDVYAMTVLGGDVYAGGDFTMAGSSIANHIARWNGSSWSALGSGIGTDDPDYTPYVWALAVSGSDLYAGGTFTNAGGIAAKNIAKWNGTTWSVVGSGVNNTIYSLAVSGSDLYAGGEFTMADSSVANHVAKWNGSSWSALGSGINAPLDYPYYGGYVFAVAASGANLYAGGRFTTAGGSAATNIAKWNGSSWSAMGSGMNADVFELAVSGNDVYVGGDLTAAGGIAANYVAKWNGGGWSALGHGSSVNAYVSALAVSSSDLYAGGYFTMAGGIAVNHIARWNGSSWSALGSGINGTVAALAVSGSDVYAGGYFTAAGGVAATNIAKWNGSSWSALGSGMNDLVWALAVSGSDLYAGGRFSTAGGNAANRIAKWDGTNWIALGSGMGGIIAEVQTLAVSGSDLYAGGYFTTPANNVAKWDGSSWSPLGSGINDWVHALAVSGNDVYAGGQFTAAGGNAANFIARWNGTSWSALGSGLGMYGNVYALAVSGTDVYAGGNFATGGGVAATNIAKWNGSSWSALGSGLNSGVDALAVLGSDLYAGGLYFTTAGGKVSAYLARAIVNPPVLAIEGDGFGGYFLRFSGVPGSAHRLQRAPGVNGPWASSNPQTTPASGRLEFWDAFPPPGQGFYRSVEP